MTVGLPVSILVGIKDPERAHYRSACSWRRRCRPAPERRTVTVRVEWEAGERRMERCDHEGTSEPAEGMRSISACLVCGKTWPARLGAGARTVRIVSKLDGA
jgi:hypothetical protein